MATMDVLLQIINQMPAVFVFAAETEALNNNMQRKEDC